MAGHHKHGVFPFAFKEEGVHVLLSSTEGRVGVSKEGDAGMRMPYAFPGRHKQVACTLRTRPDPLVRHRVGSMSYGSPLPKNLASG